MGNPEAPHDITVVEVDKNGFTVKDIGDVAVVFSELERIGNEYIEAYPDEAQVVILPLFRLWYGK